MVEASREIHVWTIQMARWRLARDQGIYLLDTTAKSGIQAFAPEWAMVMDLKADYVSEDEYEAAYRQRMTYTQATQPQVWSQLTDHPRMAIACYCRAGAFCHRYLFADILPDYLEEQGFTMLLHGELR